MEGSYITYNDNQGNSSLNTTSIAYPFGAGCTSVQHFGGQNETFTILVFETPLSTGPVDVCEGEQAQILFGGVLDGGNTIEASFDETTVLFNITQLELVSDSVSLIMGAYEGEASVTIRDNNQTIIEEYTTNAQGLFRYEP
jgi:hypothetical protein